MIFMVMPETDLLEKENRILIKYPTKIIRVEATQHWYEKDGFDVISIITENGTYHISGCPNCGAVFWRKEKTK